MNKIIIFYGSKKRFLKQCPNEYLSLTYLALEADRRHKKMEVNIKGLPSSQGIDDDEDDEDTRIYVPEFVIDSNEYSGVNEHVIINFANFLSDFKIDNLYLHNPPTQISSQLNRVYGSIIKTIYEKYKTINIPHIKTINESYENRIIGQNEVKIQLLKALFPLTAKRRKKPVVMLFYGNSGIGKTETALYLSSILNEKLFRKQFSMFQNNQFNTYLFGGSYHEPSFAKDLLDRESNVILLDEFDKANPYFHSAFYQLFDEGIYVDSNYHVALDKAIIICTSNYQTIKEIKEKLGIPIYNRFDVIIHFKELSEDAITKITQRIYENVSEAYKKDYNFVLDDDIKNKLFLAATKCENAREIQHLVDDLFSLSVVKNIIDEGKE